MLDQDFVAILRRYLRYLPDEEQLGADACLHDLGLDSMGSVALMIDLEERFGTELPDRLLTPQTFATPHSLWEALHTGAEQPAS